MVVDVAPNVYMWNISESDRECLTSLEYVLKRFTDYEKELLCHIKCMPYLQRKFKDLLFFQEGDRNVVVELVRKLKRYIGHLCVEDPDYNYIMVNIISNYRPNVMNTN